MPVYLVAGLDALYYLCAIPVNAAFCLTVRDRLRFGVGLSAFQGRAALRRARRFGQRRHPVKHRRRPASGRWLRLLAQLRGACVSLRGHLNLGDAAATALACGALRALTAAVAARSGSASVDIVPVFDAEAPDIALTGMIRLRAGQIIAAAARSGVNNVSGRIAKWKDTRSKAS